MGFSQAFFWDRVFLFSNYHLEHHYFPRVPCYNLPALRGVLDPFFTERGIKHRVYTDMGHSYRLDIDLAFPTLEDFLVQYWEGHFLDRRDVNDLLSMLWTWQYGDIGQTPGFDGDHVKALQSIKAKLIAMPALKDLYFPPEDEEYASQYIPNGEVRVIPGVWGHFAGSGDCAVDRKWIDDVIKELLAS